MGKQTEAVKRRLRYEGTILAGHALDTINRLEKQRDALISFARFAHEWLNNGLLGDGTLEQQRRELQGRLNAARNDVRRLADPDDKGCCG